jgi:hypothetical protein
MRAWLADLDSDWDSSDAAAAGAAAVAGAAAAATAAPLPRPSNWYFYSVENDTPRKIARALQVDMADLLALNRQALGPKLLPTSRLRADTRLVVPCGGVWDRWRKKGHRFIGARICRVFDGARVGARVMAWLPSPVSGEAEPVLWHIQHDDGDEEDLEEDEVLAAMAEEKAGAANKRGKRQTKEKGAGEQVKKKKEKEKEKKQQQRRRITECTEGARAARSRLRRGGHTL